MDLKKVKYIMYAIGAGVALAALLCILTKSLVFLWLMLACVLALVYVETTLWRCPECGKQLGHLDASFCPHCGKKLENFE